MKKTRKINWLPLAAFTAVMVMAAVVLLGCKEDEPTNKPPVASAEASDPTPTLASGLSVTLNGSGIDTDGTVVSYAWTKLSGPSNTSIADADKATAKVTGFNKAGEHKFQLTVLDDKGAPGVSTVTVNVKPITKTITVPALAANPGTSINFSQTITGWDTTFPSTDVHYILKLDNTPFPKGTTSVSASGLQDDSFHTITQTFYYKEVPIQGGSRSIEVEVSGNAFTDVYGSFGALPLSLNKTEL